MQKSLGHYQRPTVKKYKCEITTVYEEENKSFINMWNLLQMMARKYANSKVVPL